MEEAQDLRKISEVFLEFAAPLREELQRNGRDSPEELDRALHFAWLVWNAVVVDTLRGNGDTVSKLAALTEEVGLVPLLIEEMAKRKRTLFGSDQRLIEHYKLVQEEGGMRLSVQAREP